MMKYYKTFKNRCMYTKLDPSVIDSFSIICVFFPPLARIIETALCSKIYTFPNGQPLTSSFAYIKERK